MANKKLSRDERTSSTIWESYMFWVAGSKNLVVWGRTEAMTEKQRDFVTTRLIMHVCKLCGFTLNAVDLQDLTETIPTAVDRHALAVPACDIDGIFVCNDLAAGSSNLAEALEHKRTSR
jgi:hypothetical protein